MQSFFCTGLDSRVFDDDSVLGKSRYLLPRVVNVTAGLIPVRLPEQTFLSEPYYTFKACHVCDTQLKAGETEGKKDAAQESWPTQLLPLVRTVPRLTGERGCLVLCGPATERTGDGSAESQDDTAVLPLVCSCCLVHEMSAQPTNEKQYN